MSAHDAWVEEARAVPVLQAAELLGFRLRRVGAEQVGPCLACGGRRDRFSLHPGRNVWNCGHAGGAGGDALALVQHVEACDFRSAVARLTGRPDPRGEPETEAERAERGRRQAARAAARAEAEREREDRAAQFKENERRAARALWDRGVPFAGTLAERYLAHRGIAAPADAHLRFAAEHPFFLAPDGSLDEHGRRNPARLVGRFPAMLAAITGADGVFRGLHQTWLDPRLGTAAMPLSASGKALVVDPATGEVLPAKKVRGGTMGHRIELVRRAAPELLVIGEGIETVLSVWRALDECPALAGAAYWSAISLGNLTGGVADRVAHPTERVLRRLPDGREVDGGPRRVPGPTPNLASEAVAIPDSVRRLFLLGDGDSDPFATETALARAQRRHWRPAGPDHPGRAVAVAMAPAGQDFNSLWLGRERVAA